MRNSKHSVSVALRSRHQGAHPLRHATHDDDKQWQIVYWANPPTGISLP